jgi:hypothetical protein
MIENQIAWPCLSYWDSSDVLTLIRISWQYTPDRRVSVDSLSWKNLMEVAKESYLNPHHRYTVRLLASILLEFVKLEYVI